MCGNIVTPRQQMVCMGCANTFHVIKNPKCLKCGKPLEQEEQEYCFDCTRQTFHFNRGMALWVYDEKVKKSIANFKFHNRREYSKYYVQELLNYYREEIIKTAPDILVPVPLHKSKLKERGFNQAYLLAQGISKSVGIPVVENYLIRSHKTKAQKRLDNRERANNLHGAFALNSSYSEIIFNKIMLIDDIYTTGSTIDACAEVLLQVGVKEIYFLSLSIGRGF